MGEVYRARDTTLYHDVALKVLPEVFALEPDRLARFKREAQGLAWSSGRTSRWEPSSRSSSLPSAYS